MTTLAADYVHDAAFHDDTLENHGCFLDPDVILGKGHKDALHVPLAVIVAAVAVDLPVLGHCYGAVGIEDLLGEGCAVLVASKADSAAGGNVYLH